MLCQKCNEELEHGAAFCGICGFNVTGYVDESDSYTDADKLALNIENEEGKSEKRIKKKHKIKNDKTEKPATKNLKLKIALGCSGVTVALIFILYMVSVFTVSEGEKILQKIPLGRNIEFVEKETGVDFVSDSVSDYLKNICEYDFIYESENTVKISGIKLPEWVVALNKGNDGTILKASYYDFSSVMRSWKGFKHTGEINTTDIFYGMKFKDVNKVLNFNPYSIAKGIDNRTTYIYRYHYIDDVSGNDIVCNYYIIFNDVDDTVKDAYTSNIDYGVFLLSVETL